MTDFDEQMKGIECRRTDKLIDELPAAYKDIDEVMENAKELVNVHHVLRQILNVKGD
jgi:tRNA-splicing ligase RtcB